MRPLFYSKKVSEYDQEIPQSLKSEKNPRWGAFETDEGGPELSKHFY